MIPLPHTVPPWEMKRSFGLGADDPRDVANVYTWSRTPGETSEDGTTFTDFLAKLNNDCTVSGEARSLAGSFGGSCHWRLPTVDELKSILLESCPGEPSPCLDPAFGPTSMNLPYWSATTIGDSPTSALVVSFGNGSEEQSAKSNVGYVRAVRGVMSGVVGVGSFPCPETGCGADRICVESIGTNYCALRCDIAEIGIQGPCGTRALCSDVEQGAGVTPACSR